MISFLLLIQPASYGKKNGIWYAAPGGQGWGRASLSRKSSIAEADTMHNPAMASTKPTAGRVIRIVNNMDHSVQV